jgi:6,7-dimethyl-8-ribityllumazine synthase
VFGRANVPTYAGELRAPATARFAIVASRWNPRIVDALIDGAQRAFSAHGVAAAAVDLVRVPGALEIPVTAAKLALTDRYAAIVALGCVVRGETRHYEHVADGCAQGLVRVALDQGVPVLNGVLAVERHEDAQARAGGAHGNKGEDVALAALELVDLWNRLDGADKDRVSKLAITGERKGRS